MKIITCPMPIIFILIPRLFYFVFAQQQLSPVLYTIVLKENSPYSALEAFKQLAVGIPDKSIKAVNFLDIGDFHAFVLEGKVDLSLSDLIKSNLVAYIEPESKIHLAKVEGEYDWKSGAPFPSTSESDGLKDNPNMKETEIHMAGSNKNKCAAKSPRFLDWKQKDICAKDGNQELMINFSSVNNQAGDAKILQSNAPWNLSRICRRPTYSPTSDYIFDGFGCADSDVYVLDTGVSVTHPQFQGRAVNVGNFSMESSQDDINGHGTHVAGIIGSYVYGVCKNIQIKAIKILTSKGTGSSIGLLRALNWIAGNHNKNRKNIIK